MPVSFAPQRPKELDDLLRRDHSLIGGILFGLDGHLIELQARAMDLVKLNSDGSSDASFGGVTKISGMPRGSVYESLDRITGAFRKIGVPNPKVEILLNLTPADLPKDGTWLDLPIAIIMLQAAGLLPDLSEQKERVFILMGEIGLHGEVRRVPGALSIAFEAKPGQNLIVPAGNEKECALILAKPGHEGCRVLPVSTLEEVIEFFQGKRKLDNALNKSIQFENAIEKAVDFGVIRGQVRAKEAACIAAAGGHNLLLVGPPGEGKSLLASAMPGIMPRLADEEKVQLTKIYSAYGALERDGVAVTRRPMRSIHHTASKQALLGGGAKVPRPGEITLAHLGVLFLDEIAEFSAATLDALRQPIESGAITIARVGATIEYPCRFTLIAAMNPCPCGYFGTDRCRCKETEVRKYLKKISGPILDRIDLQVEITRVSTEDRFAKAEENVSPALRHTIESARKRQSERFQGTGIPFNAAIPGGHVLDYCRLSGAALDRYKSKIDGSSLSTRSMDRLAKVARTIADLDDCEFVEEQHIDRSAGFLIGGLLRDFR